MGPVRCSWGGVSRWLYVPLPPSGLGWSLDVLLLACEQSFFTTGSVTAPLQPGVLVLAARSSGVVFGRLSLRGPDQTPCAVPSLQRLAGADLRNI